MEDMDRYSAPYHKTSEDIRRQSQSSNKRGFKTIKQTMAKNTVTVSALTGFHKIANAVLGKEVNRHQSARRSLLTKRHTVSRRVRKHNIHYKSRTDGQKAHESQTAHLVYRISPKWNTNVENKDRNSFTPLRYGFQCSHS